MNTVTSLLDFILNLLKDPQAQAEFKANPQAVLAANGLTGVCAADIHETLPLVTDNRAVELSSSHAAPPSVAPAAGESDTHAAIRYLSYITNTYTYDDHSTAIDESVHQNIWAAGDVTQTFDNSNVVSAGQGSVAAGGSIAGTVTTGPGDAVGSGAAAGTGNVTGSGNAVGDGNAAGTGNAVANGDGSTIGNGNTVANGDHAVQGDGNVQGTVSGNSQVGTTGGTAGSDSSDHSVHDSGNTDLHSFGAGATNTLGNGNTSAAATNSGNTSDSHAVSDSGNTTDSGNATSTSTTTGSDDSNGTHVDNSSVGNTYGHDTTHETYDSHDAGLELHLH
jgi:hypothetical protein